ncbi:unnamed protein product [Protopolystoma xenopodis]|uniref:Uncharacterized protein n=1 Tax=Protopolystoma xenopodis TaxID=117903 RepID=A0A3S5CJ21_9PLAT|nr:unnamed protein product [Protopolystoma xenopodis]
MLYKCESSNSDDAHLTMDESIAHYARNEEECLVICVSLNAVLNPNGDSITGILRHLVKSTYESLYNELSYEMAVSSTALSQVIHRNPIIFRIFNVHIVLITTS